MDRRRPPRAVHVQPVATSIRNQRNVSQMSRRDFSTVEEERRVDRRVDHDGRPRIGEVEK